MVKRNEKKVVVALSIALLLVFSLVASLIPGINSKAAAPTFNGTISVTIPPVSSTLDQSSLDEYIASESTPATTAYIVAANRPPSLDEVNVWLLATLNSGSYVTPSWGYPSDYSTTVDAGKDYYFVYVFFANTLFNEDSTVTVNGASDQEFLGVKNNSTGTGDLGLMAGWVKVSILETPTPDDPDDPVDPVTPVDPVDSGTPSTPASTDTNTVPATNQVTPSADTTSNTTKATAPKTEDALPIVLIISIIGAGALTSAMTIFSRKRQ